MWIVKPGTKSRGRGIEVMRNFDEIIKYTQDNKGSKWVVQKYIENPMIIDRKKFDIRQWVLVTDWNPLTVWAYRGSYVRLAAKDYDSNKNDRFAHLTNNCVVKQFLQKEMEEEYGSEEDADGVELDNIMSTEDFGVHLNKHYRQEDNQDVFEDIIWP
jgi:tubulin monoglycylase TTLL3/8